MARRRHVPSLRRLCLLNVANHMDSYWCRDYATNLATQDFIMYLLGPFEYATNDDIQELILILTTENRIRRVHLELLLTTNITKLHLHFPRSVKITLSAITKLISVRCQNLTELTLMHDGTKVSVNHLISMVSSLPNLLYLDLSETSANDQVLTVLARTCTRLKALRVRCCPITDCSIMALCMSQDHGPLLTLQTLDLRGTALKPSSLRMALDKLPNLRHLLHDDVVRSLTLLHLDDPLIPDRIHPLQTLIGYGLSSHLPLPETDTKLYHKIALYCPFITVINFVDLPGDECLLYFINHHLRSLTLAAFLDESHITFRLGILPLVEKCGRNLEALSLSQIDDIDVGLIGIHCPKLKKFELLLYDLQKFHVQYSDPKMPVFTQLEELTLAQSDQTMSGTLSPVLEPILESAWQLRHIRITCLTSFDDVTLLSVLRKNHFLHLESLLINECHNITYRALVELIFTHCPELAKIEMVRCKNIYRRDYDVLLRTVKENHFDLDVKWT